MNAAYGVANHVEGRCNSAVPHGSGRPYINHIEGYGNTISGHVCASHVQGVAAEAAHNNAYVWSGVLEKTDSG